jgi:hypothetical protein
MPKLNKVQEYAVRWLHSQNMAVEKISIETKLKIEDIERTIEKYGISDNNQKVPDKTKKVKNHAMINETSGTKNKGVTIMTPEASQQGDAARGKTVNRQHNNPNIFRPNNG